MTHIIPREVRHNSFDKDTFRQVKALLENIPSECFESKNVAKIGSDVGNAAELIALQSRWPKEEMMWIVSIEPAYFLQYKKDSSAILVVDGVTVIVYRPKFLEYPQIVDIPKLLEAESPVQIELTSRGEETVDALTEPTKQWIQKYYATFYGKEGVKTAEFETEFLRNLKYYLSRYSRKMYWHAVLGPAKTAVHHFDEMATSMRFKINSAQPKQLFLYSLKGVNDPIKNVILNKWKQILAFIMLFLLLLVVVACPNTPPPPPESQYAFQTEEQKSALQLSFCANRTTIYYAIGGFFFLMTGLQIAGRKKPKIPTATKTE